MMRKTKSVLSVLLIILGLLLAAGIMRAQGKARGAESKASKASLRITQCALKVNGMFCGGCAAGVQAGLLKMRGVKAAKADWKTGAVQVDYDPNKITPEEIVTSFNKTYPNVRAEVTEATPK
jgi:copper chaperone CopZ